MINNTITIAETYIGTDGKRKLRSHGLSRTPEYRCWQTMRLRCHNPKNPAYKDYGARGITVCERWLDDPQAFLDDMGTKPTPDHEIDRKDNSLGYEPGNCRWVLREINCRNRRSNHLIEFNGEQKTLVEWSTQTGIRAESIDARIKSGWSIERALTTPSRPKAENGQAKTTKIFCSECGRKSTRLRCITCSNKSRSKTIQ